MLGAVVAATKAGVDFGGTGSDADDNVTGGGWGVDRCEDDVDEELDEDVVFALTEGVRSTP